MFIHPRLSDCWPDAASLTPYEADALAFCRAWQRGQSTFTLYTSGSTGTPKPIQLTRAQMQASAHLTGQALGLQPGDPALVCLNIRYVAGVMMLVRGLELGLPMTIIEPASNPLAGLDTPIAFTALVPLQLQTILTDATTDYRPRLNAMRGILVGGAATSPALEADIQPLRVPVFATYGMTETVSHIALRRLSGPVPDSAFTALPGVTLGTDERGCLHITAAASNFERVQTNDVVELLDAHRFRILGRADSIINSGGVKVQPEPIERQVQQLLNAWGLAPRLFVAGLPDARLGQRITLVLEATSLTDDQWAAVQQTVRTQSGAYAVPRAWVSLTAFAETATGKIDRTATVGQIR